MTSVERNDLMPAQEKLEWVTSKISLMVAEDTEGSKDFSPDEQGQTEFGANSGSS
jgi:hypothetical protein